MEQFPHLNFVQKITGKPRYPKNPSPSERSDNNRKNRQEHSEYLSNKTSNIKGNWANAYFARQNQDLAQLDEDIIPIFLKLNPNLFNNFEFNLQSFGIEIISEEEEGYIIGASIDGLNSLEEKIAGFVSKTYSTGKIADLWEIIDGNREEWKPNHILSEELFAKWNDIQDNELYKIEVSIAFDKAIIKEPDPTKRGYQKKLETFRDEQEKRDNLLMQREDDFEKFISHYGNITSGYVGLGDSFACEVEINGKGLKDLVFNYPFVFEVSEIEVISGLEGGIGEEPDFELEVLPPEKGSPVVGVIDSGIMENHKYISAAIERANSKSYIIGDDSTADHVQGGGHGTRVAGAVLYPTGVSDIATPYRLPCFIRNIRVLDNERRLVDMFPAELMQTIIEQNGNCKIYNLSINSSVPYRKKHMSTWAATIDSLIHEKDVLFIISAGNIPKVDIRLNLNNKLNYPDYLQTPNCRLANPAQSSFALTVGSINHEQFEDANWVSLGEAGDISAFSRIGTGIWGEIKPDVVEFGGGLITSKNGHHLVIENQHTAPELLRSTLHGGSAFSKDRVGTSYATPKVANIVAQLQKLYPEENVNLLRAFVVQGARLPKNHFLNPTTESIQYFGYGLPSIERVTKNTEQRITFYNTGTISVDDGHIYSLTIPDELRNQADEYNILIEVTLAYTAKIRRTRQRTKSYLSTWLDWTSSKFEEKLEDFASRSIIMEDEEIDIENIHDDVIQWKIRERSNWGDVREINRNNSTVQKDWARIKSHQLPEELSFAVRAHKGWDKNKEEVPYALVVSIEVLNANIPIYESIRIENEIEIPVRV